MALLLFLATLAFALQCRATSPIFIDGGSRGDSISMAFLSDKRAVIAYSTLTGE